MFKKLALKLKTWYTKFLDWNYKVHLSDIEKSREFNPKYKYLKIGEILQINDILVSADSTYIIGRPSCKIKPGTIIDQYLYSFKPKRKVEVSYK